MRTAPGVWVVEMRFNLSMPFDDDPGPEPPHPILGDIRVREAITMAVNRDRINHELITGTVFELDSPLQVGWMGCEVDPFTFDPEGAMALLDEVGWRDEDGDGIREAHGVEGVEDGTPLSMTMNGYTGFDTLDLIELAVQEDLANIGMEVAIENQEFAVIFGTWEDGAPMMLGDYDILIYDSGLFAEPGNDIANRYHPDRIPSADVPGGDNIYRWVRDDEWIEAANATPMSSSDMRTSAWWRTQSAEYHHLRSCSSRRAAPPTGFSVRHRHLEYATRLENGGSSSRAVHLIWSRNDPRQNPVVPSPPAAHQAATVAALRIGSPASPDATASPPRPGGDAIGRWFILRRILWAIPLLVFAVSSSTAF